MLALTFHRRCAASADEFYIIYLMPRPMISRIRDISAVRHMGEAAAIISSPSQEAAR